MDSDRFDFKIVVLLVLLIFVIVGALGISKYQTKELESKQSTRERTDGTKAVEEPTEEKTEEEKKAEHADAIEKTMDSKLVAKGLLKNEGVTYRTVHIKKAGYINDNPGYIYYTMYGKFQCAEGYDPLTENTCIYQPQMADPDENGYFDYAFGIEVKVDGDIETFGEIVDPLRDTVPSAVMLNEELK